MEFPARTDATAVVPVMPAEAANLRELANRADNRFLRVLLRAQAVYEDAFADRLPTYQPPRDARLWQAALDVPRCRGRRMHSDHARRQHHPDRTRT